MSQTLEHLMERIPVGLVAVSKTGYVISANSHFAKMLGYAKAELQGLCVEKLLPESFRNKHVELRNAFVKDPGAADLGHARVVSALRKDGTVVKVEIMLDYQQDAEHQVLVTVVEVSAREFALEALRESQEINKTGTWSFDLHADEVRWSPELFRIFDLPVSDLAPPYETHKSLFTDESWARLEPAVADAAERGIPYELELELSKTTKNNTRRYAVARCEPLRDENGEVVRLVGTFQDVTEIATTRKDRDLVLERLTLAKTVAGIGIWEWDLETDEAVWDAQMYEMYGLDGPPTTYEDWRNTLHPDDVEGAEERLQRGLQDKGIFESSFRIIKGTEIRHILVFAQIHQQRVVGVNMDVTAQVKLREEARRLNNLESLGALAGGIAHDFNNQLASISARADLMAHRADDPVFVANLAKELQAAVATSKSLTAQLLTFAKGNEPIRKSASIEELVVQNAEFSARGTGLKTTFAFEANLWNVNVDAHQIGQVIQNIVINAIQAMSASGAELKVKAHNITIDNHMPGLNAGNYIELTFEDNGPGMPEDVAMRVFDPYFTTKQKGHGLGLAICHSIIAQHDGSISVSSTVGKGTLFTIRLPATETPVQRNSIETSPTSGNGRVLIVDDMQDVLDMTGQMVEVLGYQYELAGSVTEALNCYAQASATGQNFDLVITDLTMPGSGGGWELLKQLRSSDPETPVIVATGYADNLGASQQDGLAFAGKLNKPFSLQDLGTELHRVLAQGKPQ